MRSRALILSLAAAGAVVAGCTFTDLASYEVAGDDGGAVVTGPGADTDGGGGSGEGGASSCTDDTGASVAVGASVPCAATETGTAIVFPLAADPRGICKRGTKTCTSSGAFDRCIGAVGPANRDCTSTNDNDCNGVGDSTECAGCTKADATQATIGGTDSCFDFPLPAHAGVGVCKPGTKTCKVSADKTGLQWGACVGEVGPTTTGYDLSCAPTADDNCNGTPADNPSCICKNGDTRVCGDCNRTTQTCTNGAFPACPAAGSNVYNGVAKGAPCSGGIGVCAAAGTVICPANGGPATCSNLPSAPRARDCSSSNDNDCNGAADNTEAVCKCGGTVSAGTSAACGQCGGTAICTAAGPTVGYGSCSKGPPVAKDHVVAAPPVAFTDGNAQNSQVGTWAAPALPFAGNFTVSFFPSQSGNVDNTHGWNDASGPAAEIACSTGGSVLLGSADFGKGVPGATRTLTCPAGATVNVKKRTNWGGGCCGGYTRTITFTNVNYTDC